MTNDEIDRLVAYYMDSFRTNREADAISYGPLSPEFAAQRAAWVRAELRGAESALLHNHLESTQRLAFDLLREAGIRNVEPDALARLSFRLLSARVDTLREDAKRLPPDSPTGSTGAVEVSPQLLPKVSELAGAYLEYRDTSDPMSPNTRGEVETAIATLVNLLGDGPLASVRNKDAQDYAANVARLPQRWRQKFKGKTAREVLAETEGKNLPRVLPATVNKEIGLVKAFWRWSVTREELPRNAMDAIKPLDAGDAKSKRKSLTESDLAQLAPVIASQRAKRPERFWIATLLAYSGARLAEIAQLRKEDVQQVEGIHCLRITADVEDGSLKTEASERLVPIHSAVIAKGFLEFVNASPEGSLFPDPDGQPVSKWFNRQIVKLKLPDGSKKKLHSLRHTMRDRLRSAGVDPGDAPGDPWACA